MASLGSIGKYELLKQLAVGGMAEIYLARQSGPEGFAKLVVIKRILPHLASQERFVNMFLDEARVAASFNHPNIVQIFDLGQQDDAFYIAMEFIPGEDIKSIVRRCAQNHRKIPIEHIVKIFSGVLDGLHFAHNQKNLDGEGVGVIHRDVSPHNIIVSFQGGVKLVDFGIAKARSEISTTIPGRIKGKHAYMSPEQVRGEDLDGRSDIFAVGIVMYELLSWSRLFKRKHHMDTLRAVVNAPIRPLRKLNPNVDEELERIVLKALERDKSKRYETAQQMQIELEDYLLKAGLRSNSVLLGKFVSELFEDKLQAREKALTELNAANLESVVLQDEGRKGPDLVAFLDMFFGGVSPGSQPAAGDAPEFTPSGDYTPLPPPGRAPISESSHREIPARARGEFLTRKAPPPKAPDGMSIKHISPGNNQEPGLEDLPGVQPGTPQLLDPVQNPVPGALQSDVPYSDPSDYSQEIDPMGQSKGKAIKIVLIMLVLGAIATVLYMFKDELTEMGKEKAPETGVAEVVSIPGGADVYLDDKHQQDTTPMEITGLKPGQEYSLRVSLPGLPDWKTSINIEDTTKHLKIKAVLSKQEAEKARMGGVPIVSGVEGDGVGKVSIVSEPKGALIYLDGVATKYKTPATLKGVSGGKDHVILLEHEGYRASYERFHLDKDTEKKIELKMDKGKPRPGRYVLRFETEPDGAKVSINGYPMKKHTPLAAKLLAGFPSEIELEHEDLKKKKVITVRPVPNVDLTVFVKLK